MSRDDSRLQGFVDQVRTFLLVYEKRCLMPMNLPPLDEIVVFDYCLRFCSLST